MVYNICNTRKSHSYKDTHKSTDSGSAIVTLKGDIVLGRGHDNFSTAINKFTTPNDGKVSIWIYGRMTDENKQKELDI